MKEGIIDWFGKFLILIWISVYKFVDTCLIGDIKKYILPTIINFQSFIVNYYN